MADEPDSQDWSAALCLFTLEDFRRYAEPRGIPDNAIAYLWNSEISYGPAMSFVFARSEHLPVAVAALLSSAIHGRGLQKPSAAYVTLDDGNQVLADFDARLNRETVHSTQKTLLRPVRSLMPPVVFDVFERVLRRELDLGVEDDDSYADLIARALGRARLETFDEDSPPLKGRVVTGRWKDGFMSYVEWFVREAKALGA